MHVRFVPESDITKNNWLSARSAWSTTYVCVAIDTDQNLLLSPLTIMDDPTSAHGGTIMFARNGKLFSEQAWQRGLSALEEFKRREGHCRVPRFYLEGSYRLGQWVAVQRYSKNSLTAERKARLNELGFIWSRPDWLWEKGFATLKAFEAREGHCLVPALHIEGEHKLGYWVSTQRRKKNKMSDERKQRLNRIGFIWRPWMSKKPTFQLHHNADRSVYGSTLGL